MATQSLDSPFSTSIIKDGDQEMFLQEDVRSKIEALERKLQTSCLVGELEIARYLNDTRSTLKRMDQDVRRSTDPLFVQKYLERISLFESSLNIIETQLSVFSLMSSFVCGLLFREDETGHYCNGTRW